MRFEKNSLIGVLLKLPFQDFFRETFRDLPGTFRDSVFFEIDSVFLLFLVFRTEKKAEQLVLSQMPFPGGKGWPGGSHESHFTLFCNIATSLINGYAFVSGGIPPHGPQQIRPDAPLLASTLNENSTNVYI